MLNLRPFAVVLALPLFATLTMCHSSSPQHEPVQAADVYASLPPAQAAKHYVIRRAPGAVVVDGDIHKAVWKDAAWTDWFVDIEGDLKPRPAFKTRVKMMWDDENIYFAAELEEPHVWATLTERDSVIFHDNDFEVFLYPSYDAMPVRNYYEFEINALNTVWDLCLPKPYREQGQADNSWTIKGLRTAVKVHGTINDPSDVDRGWDVEIAMPFAAFDRHAKTRAGGPVPLVGEKWKLNFSRVEWDVTVEGGKYVKVPQRPEHNWVWSPMGLVDMHVPQRWGVVEFWK
jgi:hypothetical protein